MYTRSPNPLGMKSAMDTPEFHVADIALVSNGGSKSGGYMIVPLISNNDTVTQVFPIYSQKRVDTAAANFPKVLNEMIRLTGSRGGFNRLRDSAVLNKLPRKNNFQSAIPERRSKVLSNLSGVIKCKPILNPNFGKLTLAAGDRSSPGERKTLSRNESNSKRSVKVSCNSCLTLIDADFKYCPSCGARRRNLSSPSNDDPPSQCKSQSVKLRIRCNNCARLVNRYNMKFHIATCQGQRRGKEATLHKEQLIAAGKSFQEPKEKDFDQKEYSSSNRPFTCDSPSEPIKSTGSYNLDTLEEKTHLEEQQGPLFECPTCLRTFLARSLAIHRRSCGHTLNFQRRPLKEEDNSPALTAMKSRKHSIKGRWRP